MCNLSVGIREQGIQQGIEQGMQQGKLEAAKIMIDNGMSLSFVSEQLSLDKGVVEKFLEDGSIPNDIDRPNSSTTV